MSQRGTDRQIDNIEFNVADIARSKDFYGSVFGWTFTDYGPTYTEFSDGRLTGGFTTGEAVRPGGPLVILYAEDLAETQRRVESAGARISRAVFSFPGGQRFHFLDPDGYELAVWSAVA
ncbi:bleomycin resistance protein [Pandoraea captiosa]|uniref:Bleomycin resistance protein n=1 Tax=Pandoraea captiosa TaxID=2508302 RepID=A0A5E4ZT44_9BURK|nr:VOC family protein [Pandoraea captiosa]VVE64068.1 bleomycin resistance protein [Pandoraea captiosa]